MNWPTRCCFLIISLILGLLIGTQYEYFTPKKITAPPYSAMDSVDMALVLAEKGDFNQAFFLMRQAIHRAGNGPNTFSDLWTATQKIHGQFGKESILSDSLGRDLLTNLDSALVRSNSVYDFDSLYQMRLAILAEIGSGMVGPLAIQNSDSHGEPLALMRAGLKSLKEGEGDRAEFLIQAALQSQAKIPSTASGLWKEYKDYLDSNPKLDAYDRLTRLSSYLNRVEGTLVACSNLLDFQVVWEVRKHLLDEKSVSHESLLNEALKKVKALTSNLKGEIESKRSLAVFSLIGSQSDQLKASALLVLTTESTKPIATNKVAESIRELLNVVIASATNDVATINKRVESAAKNDKKGDSVDPDKLGVFEKISQDIQKLALSIESADLPTWILMTTPVKVKNEKTKEELKTSSLGNPPENPLVISSTQINTSLSQLQGEVARLQGVRYNLWALRTIYGAESSENWDIELGQIDLGLLHPTVSALYSITYDTLLRKQTDPLIRAGMVRAILNSKKMVLSEF